MLDSAQRAIMETTLLWLLVTPIAVLLLTLAAAAVRHVWSSRTLRHQTPRKNASSPFDSSFPVPSAPSHPPLRRSLSEVINEEEQRAEHFSAEPAPLPLTSTPFPRRDSVGNGHLSRNSVVVHSPVSAASPSLPHPPPSPFLWTRPPAFSPQYTNNLSATAAAPSPASRRSLPPLPSSAATSTATSASLSKPSPLPSVAAAASSRKRGASPHIISLSDAIGLSQPDKRSRRARGRDARDADEDDVEMADSGARRRAKRKEPRHNREDREVEDEDEDEVDDMVDLDVERTATKSSKRRNVLASPATARRQTISENELRRRKRAGRELDEPTKRLRATVTDEEDEEQEMEEEADVEGESPANGADLLAVNVDDSGAANADRASDVNDSTATAPRPPSTPAHLMPLAPASPFLPSASTALLDPSTRRKSGRMPFKSRHSLPAPAVLNSSWARDEEEETEEEKEREDKVNQMLEQGLRTGRRKFEKDGKHQQREEQKAAEGSAAQTSAINGAPSTAFTSAAGFSQQDSSSASLPSFSFTTPSMSSQPTAASSSVAGSVPLSSATLFSFGGGAGGVSAAPNATMPPFSTSTMAASSTSSSPAPFNFTAPSQQQQPLNQQPTQFASAATSAPTTLFTYPSSSASPPPSSFPASSMSGAFGASSAASQPQFGALPTSQPLQAQSSGATVGDSGGSGFRAPSRGARGGKGRAGGRR